MRLNMSETSVHTMVRRAIDDTGAQEWWCDRCGRTLLLRFPPNYSKTVLEQGDLSAQHVGGTSGLSPVGLNVPVQARLRWTDDDDRSLESWLDVGEA
jgi:hypothetical protein